MNWIGFTIGFIGIFSVITAAYYYGRISAQCDNIEKETNYSVTMALSAMEVKNTDLSELVMKIDKKLNDTTHKYEELRIMFNRAARALLWVQRKSAHMPSSSALEINRKISDVLKEISPTI